MTAPNQRDGQTKGTHQLLRWRAPGAALFEGLQVIADGQAGAWRVTLYAGGQKHHGLGPTVRDAYRAAHRSQRAATVHQCRDDLRAAVQEALQVAVAASVAHDQLADRVEVLVEGVHALGDQVDALADEVFLLRQARTRTLRQAARYRATIAAQRGAALDGAPTPAPDPPRGGLLPMEVGRIPGSVAKRTPSPADRTVIVNGEVRGPDWTPSCGTAAEQFDKLRAEWEAIPRGQRTAHDLRFVLGERRPPAD